MAANEAILRVHVRLVVTCIPLLVRVFPLKRLLRLLTPRRSWRLYRRIRPRRVAAMVRRVLRRPAHMRRRACLRKGLATFHFLRLAGAPAVLHIGVFPPGPGDRRDHAHCWVSVADTLVLDPPRQSMAAVATYGRDGCETD